jgi:nucleoside-diphosphate-sugar epimerase
MRIFFAGATGVIGRDAIPRLVVAGHEVIGTSRTWIGEPLLRRLGAQPVVLDLTAAADVVRVVREVSPDVVVNMTTDLRRPLSFRRLDRTLAGTNRLRTMGTDALLAAAAEAGAKRYVAQSFAGWFSEPGAAPDAPAPLLATAPRAAGDTVAALRHLESAVGAWDGGSALTLRFGPLYGPGTSMGAGGNVVRDVIRRRVPVVGNGAGTWSFCHVEDAGRAVALAVDSTATGVVEVVDDDPATVAAWLPELAQAVGAPSPRRMPVWLARPAIGELGVHLMTAAPAASNALARRLLEFRPRYGSWREGFRFGLGLR